MSVDSSDGRRAFGAEGEARAAAHLAGRGYRILARNVRADGVEIDVVAQRAGVVVFVEVKARHSRRLGAPEEAVDARKQARLIRGARAWLASAPIRARGVRFDVIACEVDATGRWTLRHLEAAFDASD
jgi:putative endonuclease